MPDHADDHDERLATLLEEALADIRAGRTLVHADWRARHPELAGELLDLRGMLNRLERATADWKTAVTQVQELSPAAVAVSGVRRHNDEGLPRQLGRYRVVGRLGEGGMGQVYRAEDPELGRVVAVKVPRFDGPAAGQAETRQRFVREARAAAAVHHEHVCPIYDVGEHDGTPFVVMAFVDGPSLASRLRECGRYEDMREAVILIRKVAEALEVLHAHGIIHRDLKPGNILLDAEGRPFLSDFGLARSVENPDPLTTPGQILGTPQYMSPEHASPKAGPIGPWSDIYSLGVVLYHMLTGRVPFKGDMHQVIHQIAHDSPPRPSSFRQDLDPNLEAVVLKAMAPRREGRYATAGAFAQAIASWLGGADKGSPQPALASAETTLGQKPAPTVLRSELPEGGAVTITLEHGPVKPEQLKVMVREQEPGTKRKKRRLLAITVTVAFSLFLAIAGLSLWSLWTHGPNPIPVVVGTGRQKPPDQPREGPKPAPREEHPDKPPDLPEKTPQEPPEPRQPVPDALARLQEARRERERLSKLGKPAEALPFAEKETALTAQLYGPQDPRVAVCLDNEAQLRETLKEYDQALALYERSLKIREAALGKDHPLVAANLGNLAQVYVATKSYQRAEALSRRSLAILEAIPGETQRLAVAARLTDLANLFELEGRDADAETAWRRSLDIRTAMLGAEHPDARLSAERLAALERKRLIVMKPPGGAGPSLAKKLQEQIHDEILPYLRQQNYHNVGVLKFLVQKRDGPPSDHVGTLNLTLADRLQTALLLGQDLKNLQQEGKEPIGVIQNASAVAATIPGATHLDPKGMSKLFTKKYPLLWGEEEVVPDAFVAGVAVIPSGGSTLKVSLYVFDKKGNTKVFNEFEAELNSNLLSESGKDFLVRGVDKKEEPPLLEATLALKEEALKSNASLEKGLAPSPLTDKEAPVVLEVYYDGSRIDYQIDKATKTASIPEPQAGQKVKFVIRKVDDTKTRYGVVLKVNGENTLFRETEQNLRCSKWILEEKGEQVEIKGYRLKAESSKYEEFETAPPEASAELQVKYGKDTGQISFVVFKGAGPSDLPPDDLPPNETGLNTGERLALRTIDNGTSAQPVLGQPRPASLEKAQGRALLLGSRLMRSRTRGVIVPGATQTSAAIQRVPFNPNPVPVLSATITYVRSSTPK
jgi:serine/threonine protein kinase/tetratricopeptide (TPR) repeat protein